MSLPNKARKVKYNECEFKWAATFKSEKLKVYIQNSKNQILELDLKPKNIYVDDYGDKDYENHNSITPKEIIEIIKFAAHCGWRFGVRCNKNYNLNIKKNLIDYDDKFLQLKEFEILNY